MNDGELFFNFARRPLFHEIAHHLQEGLSLGAQRAVTGMNEVEASVQRLGIDQLDGAQVTPADFGRDRRLFRRPQRTGSSSERHSG